MKNVLRVAFAAALLAGGATAASAEPSGPGGSCRLTTEAPPAQHNLAGVPRVPDTPTIECYY